MKSLKFIKIIGIVAVINLISRLLGFLRELIVSYQFGTSYKADSLIAAFSIPNFLFIVFGGSITTAFISIYGKIKDPAKQKSVRGSVLALLGIIFFIVTCILMLLPKFIISHLFFGMTPTQINLTSQIFKGMVPSTFFLIIAMVFSGILNVHGKFNVAAVSTLLMNGAFVLIAFFLFPFMGVYAHSLGLNIGAFLMFLILLISLYREQLLEVRLSLDDSKELMKLMKLALPIILGGATLQFYFLLQRVFASMLAEGYISSLNYSMKLVQLPQSILMAAITTVVYPSLSKMVNVRNVVGFQKTYFKGLKIIALTVIPVSLFIIFFAKDIVELVFQHGTFNQQSTDITTPILQVLVIAMFFHSANLFVTRFFYAKEIAITPVIIGIISVFGINLLVSFYLIHTIGPLGVAWGTTISASVNFILLVIFAGPLLDLRLHGDLLLTVFKFILFLAGQALVLTVYKLWHPVGYYYLNLLFGGVIWLAVSLILLYVLRFPERLFLNKLLQKSLK